jgi:hypothetical protein
LLETKEMSEHTESPQIPEICLFEDALPGRLFERLVSAVRAIGDERMKNNGSYTTTFWFPLDAEPTNVAEETILELHRQVDPGPECIGMEWWLGRLGYGKNLALHFDRDLALKRKTGQSLHPLYSSVLYLNAFPSAPTLVLDQVLGPDGKTRIPEKPEFGKSVEAIPNHYVVFPGTLRHGVIHESEGSERRGSREKRRKTSELRLTLLVNYWHRRPLGPICIDYDGTIYAALKDDRLDRVAEPSASNV